MNRPASAFGSRRPAWHVVSFAPLAAVLLLAASQVVAQQGEPYVIKHYTIDGGGGWSTGGEFTIEGTIGQPDAEAVQPSGGGVFAITGGFWSGVTESSGELPDRMFSDGFENRQGL